MQTIIYKDRLNCLIQPCPWDISWGFSFLFCVSQTSSAFTHIIFRMVGMFWFTENLWCKGKDSQTSNPFFICLSHLCILQSCTRSLHKDLKILFTFFFFLLSHSLLKIYRYITTLEVQLEFLLPEHTWQLSLLLYLYTGDWHKSLCFCYSLPPEGTLSILHVQTSCLCLKFPSLNIKLRWSYVK